MSRIRILVAEDNLAHASKIEMLLDQMGYNLIGIAPTSEEFLRLFHATSPDLIILDIELKGGGDGVEIAMKVKMARPTPTIFSTSFEDKETLNRALLTDPYAYLVKPIEKATLQAAIELALFKFSKDQGYTSPRLTPEWSEDLILNDCFFIKSGSKLLKVLHEDILWIEVGQDRYCDVVTEKRVYPVRTSMNHLEEKLNPSLFVRIHRSHIVNIRKIDGIDDLDLLVDIKGKNLPLGGSYKSNLLNRFRHL